VPHRGPRSRRVRSHSAPPPFPWAFPRRSPFRWSANIPAALRANFPRFRRSPSGPPACRSPALACLSAALWPLFSPPFPAVPPLSRPGSSPLSPRISPGDCARPPAPGVSGERSAPYRPARNHRGSGPRPGAEWRPGVHGPPARAVGISSLRREKPAPMVRRLRPAPGPRRFRRAVRAVPPGPEPPEERPETRREVAARRPRTPGPRRGCIQSPPRKTRPHGPAIAPGLRPPAFPASGPRRIVRPGTTGGAARDPARSGGPASTDPRPAPWMYPVSAAKNPPPWSGDCARPPAPGVPVAALKALSPPPILQLPRAASGPPPDPSAAFPPLSPGWIAASPGIPRRFRTPRRSRTREGPLLSC
jgi:hypothetical protein